MLRNFLAVVAGLVTALIGIILIEGISGMIWPAPDGIDPSDFEAMKAHVMQLPLVAFLFVIAAHVIGLFAGGYVLARIATSYHIILALVLGVLVLIGGIFNLMEIPHPDWFWGELVLYVPAAWLGARLGRKPAP